MQSLRFSVDPTLGRKGANDVMLTVAAWSEIASAERVRGESFTYEVNLRKGASSDDVLARLRTTPGVVSASQS